MKSRKVAIVNRGLNARYQNNVSNDSLFKSKIFMPIRILMAYPGRDAIVPNPLARYVLSCPGPSPSIVFSVGTSVDVPFSAAGGEGDRAAAKGLGLHL
jgi:hypothetical protein